MSTSNATSNPIDKASFLLKQPVYDDVPSATSACVIKLKVEKKEAQNNFESEEMLILRHPSKCRKNASYQLFASTLLAACLL